MTHYDNSFLLVSALAIGMFLLAAWLWSTNITLTDERDMWLAKWKASEHRRRDTEARTQRVLLAVTPLVEKTDWMTGRWGGKFNELVRLEAARNRSVDLVRKDLMDLDLVKDVGFSAFAPLPGHFTPPPPAPLADPRDVDPFRPVG